MVRCRNLVGLHSPLGYFLEARLRTLGSGVLALQLQGAAGDDVVGLVLRSGGVAKVVLVVLALFSIASWAIVLHKLWSLHRADRHTARFLDIFRRSTKFSEVQAVCRTFDDSPLVGIFQSGYAELNAQLRQSSNATASPSGTIGRPTLKSLAAVDRALLRAAAVEVTKLEARMSLLATTASITPFIGLFGTVWGIMT
jgi:biopolymer transport protein TolQ